MEGDQYHNMDNTGVITTEGQPNPPNETPGNVLSNEYPVDPKPPYIPIDVWVKEVKYSDEFQREHASLQISEEDHHPHNSPFHTMSIYRPGH